RVTHPCATRVLLHAFDLHVLSLPPAFVLSQDQTLKFNVLLKSHPGRWEERDPVTRLLARPLGLLLGPGFELATAEAYAPKRSRPPPLAYPFPNKRCIEHTTPCLSIRVETFRRADVFGSKTPSLQVRRNVFLSPRSPWEPRLYGRALGVSNVKLQMFDGAL